MSALAPTLQAFFTDSLMSQRAASPQAIAGYRDTFRLLLNFAAKRTRKQPCDLDLGDLDAPLVGSFLDHLEREVAFTTPGRPTDGTALSPQARLC